MPVDGLGSGSSTTGLRSDLLHEHPRLRPLRLARSPRQSAAGHDAAVPGQGRLTAWLAASVPFRGAAGTFLCRTPPSPSGWIEQDPEGGSPCDPPLGAAFRGPTKG